MAAFEPRVFTSIQQIPRERWEALWPPLAEGYDFYLAQEQAGIEGFEFFYLGLHSGAELVLVAPMFVADFNMGLAMPDAWRDKLARWQERMPWLLVFKTMFVGSPTSEKGLVGIAPALRGDAGLMQAFDRALAAEARRHRVFMTVFKDFMDEDLVPLAALRKLGWFGGDSLPTACLPIGVDSVEAYLDSLSSGTKKDIKRKLKKTEKGGLLQIEAVGDLTPHIDTAYQLYRNVHDNGPMHFELLTKAFFLNFTRTMPEHTVFFLYWMKDEAAPGGRRLIGLNFCFHFEDRLIDKYIGMDYSVSRDLNLYFVSFIANVRWCIEHGKKVYMLSQGGYPVKLQLGAQLIPLRTLTKLRNPLFNFFPSRFA